MTGNENEYEVALDFSNSLQLNAKIQRYFSPKTFTKLYNSLPLEGPFINKEGLVQIFVNFSAGFDKLVRFANERGLFYDPKSYSFILFLESKSCPPLVRLGTMVETSISLLNRIPSSGFAKIKKVAT
jgi:hypothetical protein